ncbi:hypothetical protein XpopCFBP1817_18935 [Xanthomonas populi]|uniref:Uncharacterized protein n=1 Tax=Xanthomonas populi TaxID=53414 RepID=A0A2S7E912_9XANT|nr:hypothetical protein XpopCFBP1817_18935 [Xanthomonas populi]
MQEQEAPDDGCPMCGRVDGWPGVSEWVTYKPCKRTGKNMLPPPDAGVDLRHCGTKNPPGSPAAFADRRAFRPCGLFRQVPVLAFVPTPWRPAFDGNAAVYA